MPAFISLVIFAYLLGAIPFALIIGRITRGIDIRQHGSGNVGATNALRVIGVKAGLLCFFLDFTKGLVPTLAAVMMFREPLEIGPTVSVPLQHLLVGIAAVVGHCFPVYLLSLGGKGVATSIGVFMALMPLPVLICIVSGLAFIYLTGYVAIASCLFTSLLPFLGWLFGYSPEYIVVTAVLALVIDLRHIGNIKRFFRGVEPRIWDKAKAPAVDHGVGKNQPADQG